MLRPGFNAEFLGKHSLLWMKQPLITSKCCSCTALKLSRTQLAQPNRHPTTHVYSDSMSRNPFQQICAMFSAHFPLIKQPPASPIHEYVIYPRIKVTSSNNSCLNPSMPYKHILACGHIVETTKPNEPCAPNCHHIESTRKNESGGLKQKREISKSVSTLAFYCDACFEAMHEALIPDNISSTQAGNISPHPFRTSPQLKT